MQLYYRKEEISLQLARLGYAVTTSTEEDFSANWLSLYNTPCFLHLTASETVHSFYLHKKNALVAVLHFHTNGSHYAESLSGLPFGGPEHENLAEEILVLFLEYCLATLVERDFKYLGAHLPAAGVHSWAKTAENAMASIGFLETSGQVNHHLLVQAGFEENLHPSAKRRLRKSQKAGFSFSSETESWEEVVDFIQTCRIQKGWQLSLTKQEISLQKSAFPDRYFFFALRGGGQLVAATICALVTPQVLYSYAPAHHTGFQNYSPVILLHKEISDWVAARGIAILDLGTSMLGNEVNVPLATFKQRLGGIISYKKSYQLTINRH